MDVEMEFQKEKEIINSGEDPDPGIFGLSYSYPGPFLFHRIRNLPVTMNTW